MISNGFTINSTREFLKRNWDHFASSNLCNLNIFPMTINRSILFGIAILGLSLFSVACQGDEDLPNVLWITVEDISPDLGCYGDENAHTPVLDGLASKGVRYVNAIASAPVCAPARSTIITGMYQTSLGSQHMRCKGKMPPGFSYYPQVLREAGYYCTNNSKEDYNLIYESDQIWDDSGNKAHWRNRKDKTQAFFSIFNLTMTHESCINSKEKHDRVTQALPADLRADPNKLVLPPYYPDTEKVRELWARHYDNIATMDIRVGEILQELEEDGLTENTIIFFYSDHGTGSPRHKRWLYDSGLIVPFIVVAPPRYQHLLRGKPGTENDELISFIDLAPTLLNLAGITIPDHMQGRAFLGDNLEPERDYVYAARDRMDERYDMQRAVRSKRFKYIRYYESYKPYTQYMNTPEKGEIMQAIREAAMNGEMPPEGAHIIAEKKPDEELFDLENDPYELNNLAGDPEFQEKLTEMREAHAQWSDQSKDAGLIPETIMRAWEAESNATIFEILRAKDVPIDEIREAALGKETAQLMNSLSHKNEAVRYWSAISLGNTDELQNHQKAVDLLYESLKDEVPAVRIAVSRALCKIGSLDASLPLLVEELDSDDEWVRLLAAQVLDEIGEDARLAENTLQKRIDLPDPNKYVVRVANRALNQMNGTINVVK